MTNNIGSCFDMGKADGLACVKRVIKEYDGTCKPKLVLLTQEHCPFCDKEKENHRAEINSGEISQIDVLSPEGIDIIKKNEMDAVPALVVLDCNNYLID